MADSLELASGIYSHTGPRERNEDFAALCEPVGRDRALRGVAAVVADGMGGARGGREASETTVRAFLDGYYAAPGTLSLERAASHALAAINRWIHGQGRTDTRLAGMATTFSALILRGREAHVVHVGDTRIYRLRDGVLLRFTEDHTLSRPDVRHVLYRAVGIEAAVRADHATHSLQAHDRFLIASDGLYEALREERLSALLAERHAPVEQARILVEEAVAAGTHDNATALVVDVVALPDADRGDIESLFEGLPIRPLPAPGDVVDDFELREIISDGRYSRLFLAHDRSAEREVVIKFPQPRVGTESTYRQAFTREAWVASQVRSPWVCEIIELAPGRRTALYSVMPYYLGRTLATRLKDRRPVALREGVGIGVHLARALTALHRRQIVHRDVKPDNVLIGPEGAIRLMDLGVVRLPGFPEFAPEDIPGTPSYMAPELFQGEPGNELSDVYALGVTLYRMWSGGHYPYGEVEPFSTPRFRRMTPLSKYRGDLPAWVESMLNRACAVEPGARHADALELAAEMEDGLARGASVSVRKLSAYERDPLRFWKLLSALLVVALVVALAF